VVPVSGATEYLGADGISAMFADNDRQARALKVRRADLALAKPVRWAWQHRAPIGFLSLLIGAEGSGKGTLMAWAIARWTNGDVPGDLHGEPVRVLIVGDEDTFDSVVVPRLHVAGADLELVDTIHEENDLLDLRENAPELRELIAAGDYRVVYFDALLDVLGVDVDDWRSKQVRDALRQLRRAARDLDVCVIGSLHPNKGTRSNFRDLLSGSHAFNAVSRSSLLLAEHPADPSRRLLVRGKGNLSVPPPGFEFTISRRRETINGYEFDLPLLADEAESELTIADVLTPARQAPVRDSLAEQIDRLGTGAIETRAEIAKALGRSADDRSVGRALEQLEDEGRWLKVGRGQWQRIGIGASKEAPMSKVDAGGAK